MIKPFLYAIGMMFAGFSYSFIKDIGLDFNAIILFFQAIIILKLVALIKYLKSNNFFSCPYHNQNNSPERD